MANAMLSKMEEKLVAKVNKAQIDKLQTVVKQLIGLVKNIQM